MVPDATPYNECYSCPHQVQALDTVGDEGAEGGSVRIARTAVHHEPLNVGPTREVFIVANLYPAPLVVASTVALRIDATGRFRPIRSGSMHDLASELDI